MIDGDNPFDDAVACAYSEGDSPPEDDFFAIFFLERAEEARRPKEDIIKELKDSDGLASLVQLSLFWRRAIIGVIDIYSFLHEVTAVTNAMLCKDPTEKSLELVI